jgi:hypothetical protein
MKLSARISTPLALMEFAGTVDQAKEQIAPITEIERRAYASGTIRSKNCAPEHHVARPQQRVGDVARAINQRRGVGFVWEGGREGVGGLAATASPSISALSASSLPIPSAILANLLVKSAP